MLKIFLGFALEESIKVIIRKHNHNQARVDNFFQDLTLDQVTLMAASILQEANNKDPHDLTLPFRAETLMVDQTLVLNLADIMAHYYNCHVRNV